MLVLCLFSVSGHGLGKLSMKYDSDTSHNNLDVQVRDWRRARYRLVLPQSPTLVYANLYLSDGAD